MTTKEKLSAISYMLNAAYKTLEAAKVFVNDNEATEPCWSVYETISSLSSTLWSIARVIENQRTEE